MVKYINSCSNIDHAVSYSQTKKVDKTSFERRYEKEVN